MKTCGKNQGKKSKEEERKNIVTYKKKQGGSRNTTIYGAKMGDETSSLS